MRRLILTLGLLLSATAHGAATLDFEAARAAQSLSFGANAAEPDVTVGHMLQANSFLSTDAFNANQTVTVPVAGNVTVTGFRCLYDSTQVIGTDSFNLCVTPVTSAGVTGALSGACVTLVNGALALDYIAPTTQPFTSFDASATDTTIGVYVQAKTDTGTADNSTLAVMCHVDFIQSN